MSEFYYRLRKQTSRLQHLLADLSDSERSGATWDTVINMTKTLGENVPIERWTLAEHFLTEWNNWSSLLGRYLSYFGQPWEKIPKSWQKLKSNCMALAIRLRSDEKLGSRLAESWRSTSDGNGTEIDIRDLFHAVIVSHERSMLLNSHANDSDDWSSCRSIFKENDDRLRVQIDRARGDVRRQTMWHLRHYRHATLDVSWLDTSRWNDTPSAFEFALKTSEREPSWIRDVQSDLPSELTPGVVAKVTFRIFTAITELGFESFAADLMSQEMIATESSPVGASGIEILTRDRHAKAAQDDARIIVGVARQPRSLASTFRQLLTAFDARRQSPTLGIVVSSCWDAFAFEQEFETDFQNCYDDGHRLILLLAGRPDTQLEPVPLSLGFQTTPEPEPISVFPARRRIVVSTKEGP